MSTQIATVATETDYSPIVAMVLDTMAPRSKRDYRRALDDFISWQVDNGRPGLNRSAVNAHVSSLKAAGVTDSSINQRLSAIRKLARESAANDLIDFNTAQSITSIKNIKIQGKKLGNWLTADQAGAMISAPGTETLKGQRDRAILAVMLGCGLRREEIAALTVEHLQMRESRWVILDLAGKHGRTRTVPMAAWVKQIVDQWLAAGEIETGPLFRPIRRGGHLQAGAISSQAVWQIVEKYSPIPGIAPHDLRRSFAKLAHKAGAPMEQIQMSLGHASIKTTEEYIGADLDLAHAPSDLIVLNIT